MTLQLRASGVDMKLAKPHRAGARLLTADADYRRPTAKLAACAAIPLAMYEP